MTINVFNEIDKIFTSAAPKHTFSRTEWGQCLECGKAVSWCDTLTKCHICGNEVVKVADYETGERLYLERKRAELDAFDRARTAAGGAWRDWSYQQQLAAVAAELSKN